jgi:FMN phosphatase YigB (HAD superfamily)
MKEIHFFDLDGTLWNIDSKVWIVDKENPKLPLLKLDKSEFELIKNGVYKKDDIISTVIMSI